MAALSEVRLDCGWAPYEIADAHDESLDVVNVALADQFEGPGAVQVISQGLVAVNTLEKKVGLAGRPFRSCVLGSYFKFKAVASKFCDRLGRFS